jgi:hypothetical protein
VGRWAARVAALLATAVLLAVGVAIAMMVRPDSESNAHDQAVSAEPTPTPTRTSSTTDTAKRKARLTRSQRAARAAAAAQLRGRGYHPVRVADWHARQTLRVLLGAQSDGGRRRAFFFVGRRYIGTDATTPSGRLRVARQRSRSITLVYSIWRRADKACCPHGGSARVRFEWDGARLTPRGAIPDAALRRPAGAS